MDYKLGAIGVPSTIAIDVTPILPGGKHGGSNVFMLELIRRLAMMTPQAVSHDEIASFDCKNVRRPMVVGALDSAGSQPHVRSLYKFFVRRRWAQGAHKCARSGGVAFFQI